MSTRAFAVFQDTPSDEKMPEPQTSLSTQTSFHELEKPSDVILSPTMEKENLHPVTGLAAPPPNLSKKRKLSESGGVLATKAVAAAASSSSKPPKSRELKRKGSTSSASGKSKSGLARKGSEGRVVLGSTVNGSSSVQPASRKPSRALSRQPTTLLGTVQEDPQESSDELPKPKSITQALIDARCYELTVKPLADVSTAYLQSSDKREAEEEEATEYRMVKEEGGFQYQLRDYFTLLTSTSTALSRSDSLSSFPSTSTISTVVSSKEHSNARITVFEGDDENEPSSLPSSPKKARREYNGEGEHSPEPVMLSTPERRELYASFTFVTPKSSPVKSK